jgi:hypothetical protein
MPNRLQILGLAVLLVACGCRHPDAPSPRPYQYLGLPHDVEYDSRDLNAKEPSDPRAQGYYRITRVGHVSKEQFEYEVNSGRILFPETHNGTTYYALKSSFHIPLNAHENHDWVWVLHRRAYP